MGVPNPLLPPPSKQNYLNYCLATTPTSIHNNNNNNTLQQQQQQQQSSENDSLKSTSPSETSSTTKSPKSDITLNALQHEQNTLIEQRIHDRTNNLRNLNGLNAPSWSQYNNYFHRMYPNVELNPGAPGGGGATPPVTAGPCLLTNPINSCMFGSNRTTVQWFNRANLPSDPWNSEYSQGKPIFNVFSSLCVIVIALESAIFGENHCYRARSVKSHWFCFWASNFQPRLGGFFKEMFSSTIHNIAKNL